MVSSPTIATNFCRCQKTKSSHTNPDRVLCVLFLHYTKNNCNFACNAVNVKQVFFHLWSQALSKSLFDLRAIWSCLTTQPSGFDLLATGTVAEDMLLSVAQLLHYLCAIRGLHLRPLCRCTIETCAESVASFLEQQPAWTTAAQLANASLVYWEFSHPPARAARRCRSKQLSWCIGSWALTKITFEIETSMTRNM